MLSSDVTCYTDYTADSTGTNYAGTGLDPDGDGESTGRWVSNESTNTITCSSKEGHIENDTVKTRGGNSPCATNKV